MLEVEVVFVHGLPPTDWRIAYGLSVGVRVGSTARIADVPRAATPGNDDEEARDGAEATDAPGPGAFRAALEVPVDLERPEEAVARLELLGRRGGGPGGAAWDRVSCGWTEIEVPLLVAGTIHEQRLPLQGEVELEVRLRFQPEVARQLLVLGAGDALCYRRAHSSCGRQRALLGQRATVVRPGSSERGDRTVACGSAIVAADSPGKATALSPRQLAREARRIQRLRWRYLEERMPELAERRRQRHAVEEAVQEQEAEEQALRLQSKKSLFRKRVDAARLRRIWQKLSTRLIGVDAPQIIRRYDRDGSGELDFDELRRLVRGGLRVPPEELEEEDIFILMTALDADGSGALSTVELMDFFERGVAMCADAVVTADELRARELLTRRFAPFLARRALE